MEIKKLYSIFEKHSKVSTDTRKISKGCIFFALKGPNFNGNEYCEEALNQGCAYAISDEHEGEKIIKVDNVLETLQQLARYHRNQMSAKIIGITGSNGKTTTKELMFSIISEKHKVIATEGNLNNHIGVPLTLLRIKQHHEIAIIEMGANQPGDIAELCEIAEPDWGIITNIGKAHLEGFGKIETTLETKTALYRKVYDRKGKLFLNIDDPLLSKACPDRSAITFAMKSRRSDIIGYLEEENPRLQMSWASLSYHSPTLITNLVGAYNIYNIIAAVSIGDALKIEPTLINQGIKKYIPTNNRSQFIKGKNNTIIMDAYNANPASMNAAIDSFIKRNEEQPLMIIGDMYELGEYEKEEHENIIHKVIESKVPTYFVGDAFQKSKTSHKNLTYFKDTSEVKDILMKKPLKNQCILLKASRGIGLEKLLEYLD